MSRPDIIGFDRYDVEDLKILHSCLMDHMGLNPDMLAHNREELADELTLLIDRNRYFLKRNAYYFMLENQKKVLEEIQWVDFTAMRLPEKNDAHKRSYFGDSDRIIHIMELPLGEVPTYMYSRNTLVKYLVRWRLEKSL